MHKNIDFRQLWQLISMHFMEIIREPGVLFWGMIFPILMSLGLGIAFTNKTKTQRKIAIVQSEKTVDSSAFTWLQAHLINDISLIPGNDTAKHSQSLTIKNDLLGDYTFDFLPMTWNEALLLLKRGKINVILTQKDNLPEFHFDPQNPDAQLSYIKLAPVFKGSGQSFIQNTNNISVLTLPGSRYIDFLIPGLVAMGIMMSTTWGLSYGIIEKRSKKLLRRMVATPMKKSYFLFSFITVRLLMNLVEALLLIIFSGLVFKTSIQGSIPALFVVFIAGNLAFAGISVFISSRTAKTEIGNGLINAIVMPMMLLSGVFFSYHNFPDKVVPIIQKFPLTMVADSMRSIFIEGAGFSEVWLPVAVLSAIGLVFFIAGLRIFKWY